MLGRLGFNAMWRKWIKAPCIWVNFSKSNIFGINLEEEFFYATSNFLSCTTIGSFPFKFLGLPVGANPRRCSTWEPAVVNALTGEALGLLEKVISYPLVAMLL